MKKVSILLTTTGFGGLELNTLKLADWLNKYYDITLIINKNSRLYREVKSENFNYIGIEQPKKYFDFKSAKKIASIIKNIGSEVVLIIDNRDIDVMVLAKRLYIKKIKLIYQQQMQIGVNKKDLLHTWRFGGLDYWVSPLNWLKQEILEKTKFPEKKIKIIPLCLETDKFTKNTLTKKESRKLLGISESSLLIGILGRITKQKGQHVLVKSLPGIIDKFPNAELLIFGEATINDPESYEYFKDLQSFVSENHLEKIVHFKDFSKDTAPFYKAIDVFGMASFDETFGMVTIETMLSGVPIIGSNSAGTAEILKMGKLGRLFEVNNIESFCQQAINTLSNMNEAHNIAQLAKEDALKNYNYRIEVDGFIELIDN